MEVRSTNTRILLRQKAVPWLGLVCILAAFVAAVIRLHPTIFFGYTEDDSIYFSSAKGLAEGKGYVLASVPGTPAATKYPIFYPWLLSWVWRLNPSFPSNLNEAVAISLFFGAVYVGFVFLFLRQFKSLCDIEVLTLTAFCALNPVVVFYSGSLLSEIPFAALALGAMLLAEKSMEQEASSEIAVCCGVLVGFCMLTRIFGVPLAAGIAVAFMVHRAWRQLLVFCGSAAPFFAALSWKLLSARSTSPPVSEAAASSLGWIHTWTYYTNYLNVWRQGVPTAAIFFTMLKNNVLVLVGAPADYFLSPLLRPRSIPGTAVVILVAAAASAGIFREARNGKFRPIHFAVPFYACLIVFWNYPHASRFLIPFLPLLALGIWLEAKRLLKAVSNTVTTIGPLPEKVLALGLGILVVSLISAVPVNYFGRARTISANASSQRGILLKEKREAYDWLSRFTAPEARVVAYEDASVFLYTGRVAIRPFTFTTAAFYDPPRLEVDLDHLTDVPRAIRAQYWLTSADDYGFEWQQAYTEAHARMRPLEQVLPVVFRSQHDHVRIYFLGCLLHPEVLGCEQVRSILFPAGHGGSWVENSRATPFVDPKVRDPRNNGVSPR
jgi:hypothetical protein